MDRGPEALIAEAAAKHAKNERALRINIVRAIGHERHRTLGVDRRELAVFVEVEIVACVAPEFRLPVRAIHELGEPLVEPEVRPVLGRLEVAEPLVRELMRDEQPAIPGAIEVSAFVREPVHELRRAHHLLAAEEIGDGRLCVLGPRIAYAREPRVRLDDVGRVAEEWSRERAVLVIYIVVDGNPAPPIVNARVGRDRHRR